MRCRTLLESVCLACTGLALAACVQDRVYPGYYGEPERDAQAITGAPRSGSPAPGGTGVHIAGAGSGPTANAGAASVDGTGGASGSAGAKPAASAGSASVRDAPIEDACDLSGRWLVTLHLVTDAIGQQQTVHSYLYYEIEKQSEGFAITKGLHCGDEAVAEGLFAVEADFRKAWPSAIARVSYVGRKVSSTPSGVGCRVTFAKWYTVRGASYPHYTDPAIPLPTVDQPANGTTPGWEDWDEDGQPGITGFISGTVTGQVFVAPRIWNELAGTVPDTGDRFELPVEWNQEYNMLGYDGTELLASDAVRAADPRLHFAELARLAPDRVTGDDLAICSAVVELAPTLTPRAAGL